MPMNNRRRNPFPGFPWKGKFTTKMEIEQYFSNPDGIQCLLCGRMHKALNTHLLVIHGISNEEYRDRYGLPWRRGLVSKEISKRLSDSLKKRIEDGSFTPKPDSKAARESIRAGHKRKDQPFLASIKADMAIGLSQKKIKYSHKDYENVLPVMLKRKITLNEACMDKDLPTRSSILGYAASNPEFRKKLLDTYYALPYVVQARAAIFSPQFYEDLRRLKGKGFSYKKIGRRLGISHKTVSKRLKQIS
jgi:hypothetical protein